MTDISGIIANLNDPLIGAVIASVQTELRQDIEITVVGLDDTQRLSQLSSITFIDTVRQVGASTARNIGIQATTAEWLIFVDSECVVMPGWADAMKARLNDGHKVVGGGVTFRLDNYWQLVYNISMFHEFLVHLPPSTRPFLPTLNLAVHRDVIRDTGLMDEELTRGQDVDWTIRMALAGYELFFEPRAAILHVPQRTDPSTVLRYWYRSGYYNVRNRLRYARYLDTPSLMGNARALRALSPAIAAYVTLNVFRGLPHLQRYWHTLPVVYLTKIAWCLGAAAGLSEPKETITQV